MEYLLKSSACLIGFYGLYYFVFRQFTFHTANRFYLLMSIGLSVLIPLVHTTKTEVEYLTAMENPPVPTLVFPQIQKEASNTNYSKIEKTEKPLWKTLEVSDYFLLFYYVGILVSICILLRNLSLILKVIKTEDYEKKALNLKIFETSSFLQNSSFFNNIFINSKPLNPDEKSLIIEHESLHCKKLHTVDLLIVGVLKCAFWFNPVIYFLQKSLKEIHEYEVDELMTKSFNQKEYANLLLKLGVFAELSFVNQMSKKPLSQRIHFMFKPATIHTKKYLYLIAIPLIAAAFMAFTKEKIVKVLREKGSTKTVKKIEVKAYPLTIKNDRDYTTWGPRASLRMLPTNISLNSLTTLRYNGFKYEVNPNSLTEKTINEVNKELKKRNLAIIITEKDLDLGGNFTKLGLSIKHLTSGKTSTPAVFDMEKCREQGQNGAFFVFDAFDRNFEKSQVSYFFGSPHLLINKSHLERSKHNTFNVNSESSIISHSSDLITYVVYPDKLTLRAVEEAKTYFSENGFKFELKDYESDAAGNLTKIMVVFGDQSRSFDLNKMRHWVILKSEANSKPQRMDESMVFEGNLKTKATKISVNDFWFKAMEKSGRYEILGKPELKTQEAISYSFDTLRTVPATNKLGKNPLVIINKVEYPSEILKRINPEKIRGYYFTPPNNPNALKKYGEKAKDGVFETESINDDFLLSDKGEFDRIQKNTKTQINAEKKRVVRLTLKNNKGENYQHVVLNRSDKETSQFGIDVPLINKIVFILNDEIVSEEFIESCNLNFVKGSCGESFSYFDFKKYGDQYRGYDGYFIVYTEKK
ncbi:MAG: M56 family metallopeptidase [Leadbetterella sp.]|nr:M56 family metallopeptidase [Leadbetterella sp.]